MEESLPSYGIKDGCKLMLIGKRVRLLMCAVPLLCDFMKPGTDNNLQTEQSWGGSGTEEAERHWEICWTDSQKAGKGRRGVDWTQKCKHWIFLHWFVVFLNVFVSKTLISSHFFQGFLAKDLQAEALGKLDHRVKIAAEQFMKILEQIDALVIYFIIGFKFVCMLFLYLT